MRMFCVASRSELVEIISVSNARSFLTLSLYNGGMALVACALYISRQGRRSNARHTITTYPIYSFQRQRSISLSSLDSENELELDGKSVGPVSVGNRACRSQTSTHSLNEADLVQVNLRDLLRGTRFPLFRAQVYYIANFSLTE